MATNAMDNKKQSGLIKNLFISNLKLLLLTIFLSMIFSFLYDFIATWSVKSILEAIITGERNRLLNFVIYLIVVYIIIGVVILLLKYIFVFLKKRGIAAIEDTIITEYYGFKGEKNSSKYLTVIQNSVPKLVKEFYDFYYNFEQIIIRSIVVVVYGAYVSFACVVFCIAVVIFFMLFLHSFHDKIPAHSKKVENSFNSMYENIWELVTNIEILDTLNKKKVYANLEGCMNECEREQIEHAKLSNMSRILSRLSSLGIILIVALYGGILSISGNFKIFNIIILTTILPALSDNLFKIPEMVANYKKIKGIEKNINFVRVIENYPEVDREEEDQSNDLFLGQSINLGDAEELQLTERIQKIEIKKLKLCIGGKKSIEADEIVFKAGKLTGIAGESGIGKTYFIQALLKYNHDYAGDIKINDIKLKSISTQSYWNEICYLTQSPVILPKLSIRDNIILNEPYFNDRYNMAVKACDLEEFIAARQDKDMSILEKDTLSSGEMQKICLARVFYTNKSLCILDEATSAIAPATEAMIIEQLKYHTRQACKLLIFITHSNEAIKNCDCMYQMENNQLGNARIYSL